MRTAARCSCPDCGHHNTPAVISCELCGNVLRRFREMRPAPREQAEYPGALEREVGRETPDGVAGMRAEPSEPGRVVLLFLGIGLLAAPVFTFTPLLRFMGWFLGSLVHETGHCAMAWLMGCRAFPAISLAGHAMASHASQSVALCFVIWAAIAYHVWKLRDAKPWPYALGAVALAYPALAFTDAKEFCFLVAGHVGELTFAVIFFWRAMVGGFTSSKVERALYATLAWYLLGQNLWLTGGLMWSAEVQQWYSGCGSFGLTNDYIRLAHDAMHVRLETVALMMFVATLAVLPIAFLAARPYRFSPRK